MKKCQFCGYEIGKFTNGKVGCLGTESKFKGKWTHKGCLENYLYRLQHEVEK